MEGNNNNNNQENNQGNAGVNDNNQQQQQQNNNNNNQSQQQSGKVYTENQIEALVQARIAQQQQNNQNNSNSNLLAKFGFKDEKEAESAFKALKKWQDSQKTDEQLAAEKAQEKDAELEQAKKRAEIADAKVEALKVGCKPENVDDVISLAVAKKSPDGDIKTVIDELKKKYPTMFNVDQQDEGNNNGRGTNKAGQYGTGGNVGNIGKNNGGSGDGNNNNLSSIGQRLAASRKISNKKGSFFSR